jgi:hypothetical protein
MDQGMARGALQFPVFCSSSTTFALCVQTPFFNGAKSLYDSFSTLFFFFFKDEDAARALRMDLGDDVIRPKASWIGLAQSKKKGRTKYTWYLVGCGKKARRKRGAMFTI